MPRSAGFVTISLVLLGTLAAGVAAWAQPPSGPGGSRLGFGPGPDMFGGPPAVSVPGQYSRLLRSNSVQKELKLSEDQQAKIKEAGDKARGAERELFSGFRDLKEEDRRAKMEEIGKKRQALEDERREVIERTLSAGQVERLKGIALQVLGAQALQDEQVQRSLELTPPQTAAIHVVAEQSRKKIGQLFVPGSDFQTARTKSEEIRADTDKRMMALLTDAQRAVLEKMKGEKFDVPSAELRGFGGPGGRGSSRSRGGDR